MLNRLVKIYHLGVKELHSLRRDVILLLLVVWAFTAAVYMSATGTGETLTDAPIAIVDEDGSPLSRRIADAFYGPYFKSPEHIDFHEIDPAMDSDEYTFVVVVPVGFQADVLAGRSPALQVNVDATRSSQAGIGAGYIQAIATAEISEYLAGVRGGDAQLVDLALRVKFNPNLTQGWFVAVMEIIDNVTLLTIVLTGAAVIREREHGTLEHLLVMPLSPFDIMAAKVWANGLVIVSIATLSLLVIVRGLLDVPLPGSVPAFVFSCVLYLFSASSIGILLATTARSMPQFALLVVLVVFPMNMLSGSATPQEAMPEALRTIMQFVPSTHFVTTAQAILYRGAGLDVVWPNLLAVTALGAAFFLAALALFRRSVAAST